MNVHPGIMGLGRLLLRHPQPQRDVVHVLTMQHVTVVMGKHFYALRDISNQVAVMDMGAKYAQAQG